MVLSGRQVPGVEPEMTYLELREHAGHIAENPASKTERGLAVALLAVIHDLEHEVGDADEDDGEEHVMIGETVRYHRRRLTMTQSELASAVGMSTSYISRLESGQRGASPSARRELNKVLGLVLDPVAD